MKVRGGVMFAGYGWLLSRRERLITGRERLDFIPAG
jgi:hypothetical protein